jgi:5-methylcytosine-specific restriction endonuclease McrA
MQVDMLGDNLTIRVRTHGSTACGARSCVSSEATPPPLQPSLTSMHKPPQVDADRQQEQRRQADHDRGSAHQRGYTSRWARYSQWFLSQATCRCGRNHTLCERGQLNGRIEPSELTDHIIPVHSASDPGFWKHSNHQGLCRPCHAIKTAEDMAVASSQNR